MTTEEARNSTGKLVMSFDPGDKMVRRLATAHGPYKLKCVTKQGLAIPEEREEFPVNPSLIHLTNPEATDMEPIQIFRKFIESPVSDHPIAKNERNRRKRRRLIKKWKRMGITTFLHPVFEWTGPET